MTKSKIGIVFVSLLFLVIACDLSYPKLRIINNSEKTVVYETTFGQNADSAKIFQNINVYSINPNDTALVHIAMGGNGASAYAINSRSPDSTLNIYIFDYWNLNNMTWQEIMDKNLYYKRVITVEELDEIDWIIKVDN